MRRERHTHKNVVNFPVWLFDQKNKTTTSERVVWLWLSHDMALAFSASQCFMSMAMPKIGLAKGETYNGNLSKARILSKNTIGLIFSSEYEKVLRNIFLKLGSMKHSEESQSMEKMGKCPFQKKKKKI